MAENSGIEWTDNTFNPWIGCVKVSAGCKFCYAENLMDKRYSRVEWGPTGKRLRTSAANWKKPLQWNRKAEKEGKRVKVFCASLADVFEDNEQLIDWRLDLFDLVKSTPFLDWLILTKRPEIAKWFFTMRPSLLTDNIWIGTSVEDQEQAKKRIPELLSIPARVRFLSCEPLLGPVSLDLIEGAVFDANWQRLEKPEIDWVIVGGESGKEARPMSPAWVEDLRVQCYSAGIPFFFKQWGEWLPGYGYGCAQPGIDYNVEHVMVGDIAMAKVGKRKAGKLLNGREYTEFPGGGS